MNHEEPIQHQQNQPSQIGEGGGGGGAAAAAPAEKAQESVSLPPPIQHAHQAQPSPSSTNNTNTSTLASSNTQPADQPPTDLNSAPQVQLPNGTHQSSPLPSQPPPPSSSPVPLPHPSSSSTVSVDVPLTASGSSQVTHSPPSNHNPASSASSSVNGNPNGVNPPSTTLDAPSSSLSAVPLANDANGSFDPSKAGGQSVGLGKTEVGSAGGLGESKVAQSSSDGPAQVGGSNGNGNRIGNGNGMAAGSGSAPSSTTDSGFVDGPSMVSGAPGSVDAAAQSLSHERLTEGGDPLPTSSSPSLAPPAQANLSSAPSVSPTSTSIPPPSAAAVPPTPTPSSSNPALSPHPPQQQQSQPSASLPIPSPLPEPTSNHVSPTPPAQAQQQQVQPSSSEDVKMADGTTYSATLASASTPAPSSALPNSASAPGSTSQPPISSLSQPTQGQSSQPPQSEVGSAIAPPQQQGDAVMQPPLVSEASSLPHQPPQQLQASDSQSVAQPSAAPQAQPSNAAPPPQQPQATAAQADSEPPSKRQRFEGEGPVDAYGTPIIEMTAAQIKFAQNSIKSLKSRPEAPAFLQPVDPIALGIPQYRTFITQPADLGSIDIKLALTSAASKSQAAGGAEVKPTEKVKLATQFGLDPRKDVYRTAQLWEEEVRRVFSNCRKFNGPEHPLSKGCDALEKTFDKQMSSFPSAKPQEAYAVDDSPNDKKIRRPSNPVPTIRRSSDDASGRPKREIHPPPPKDMAYWDEPATGAANRAGAGGSKRKAKTSAANSVAERAYQEKVNKDELRFCEKVVQELYGPKHQAVAWVFYDLVDRNLDFAPAYYATIKNPISLREIQSKLKGGDYENRKAFDSDMQLLFRNCFTFNPPGTDVHTMGQKVKSAYESRMRSMPKPPPFVAPQEFGDDVDDGEEGDDSSDAVMAAQIRQQIESLQANLAQLEGSKKKNPKAIANTKASLASMQSSAMTKAPRARPTPSAVPSAAPIAAPAAAPRKSGPKKANGEKKKSNAGTKRKNSSSAGAGGKRKANGDAGSDEDVRVVTYEQKEELASKITELPDDRLDGALKIIAEDKPPGQMDEEEIELDIDDLSPKTLYKLYKYVVRPKKPRTGANNGGAGSGQKKKKTGKQGGNNKRVLDEAAEAKRIASLQTQLSQFEQGVPQPAAAGGPSGAHDDMVDSGSSGSDSDSDSDDDAY